MFTVHHHFCTFFLYLYMHAYLIKMLITETKKKKPQKSLKRDSREMDMKGSRISVLMLPWLAHGHICPFLELAKMLTKRNFHIYLCSTPTNLNSIKEKIPQKYSFSIQLVEILLPSFPELPPLYHTTNGLPPHLMSTLKKAFDMASPNFYKILKTLAPNLLIYDFLQPWAPALAESLNIPAVIFLSCSTTMTTFCIHLSRNPSVRYPFPEIYLHDHEVHQFNHLVGSSDNGVNVGDRVNECHKRSLNIILIKTFRELEGKYLDYLSHLTDKKIVPVGPLVQEEINKEEGEEIIEWLNKKEIFSTVFVSFGSEYFLSKEEIKEMAHGLELSTMNFIWVVRFPMGEKVSVDEAVPNGFFSRVGERGMIVQGWAPQARILGHCSIGGFVSHCGWSSVMESMKYGVPILAMPMHLDQPLNARVVEEVGVGVEIKRDKDGWIQKEQVAKMVKDVVKEKSGEKIRKKIKEMSEKLRNKGDEEIDGAVEELVHLCLKCR